MLQDSHSKRKGLPPSLKTPKPRGNPSTHRVVNQFQIYPPRPVSYARTYPHPHFPNQIPNSQPYKSHPTPMSSSPCPDPDTACAAPSPGGDPASRSRAKQPVIGRCLSFHCPLRATASVSLGGEIGHRQWYMWWVYTLNPTRRAGKILLVSKTN